MTIRRQAFLVIVPVFALLALVGHGVAYFMQTYALRHGLHEEAGALAVSTAAFIRPADLAELQAGRLSPVLSEALERMKRWDTLRGFVVWDREGKKILYQRTENGTLPAPPSDVLSQLARRPWVNTELLHVEGAQRLVAYAPILDANGGVGALFASAIDATAYRNEVIQLRRSLASRSLLVIGFGVGVAWLLSGVISREIRRLARAARDIDRGEYVLPPSGLIQEVTELGHTFAVLDSVIDEVRAKSQRALADNERFRSEQDLLEVYRPAVRAAVNTELAGRAVAVKAFGAGSPLCIDLVDSKDDRAWIVFGRVEGNAELSAAALASAVQHELAERFRRDEPAHSILLEVGRLFDLRSLVALTWRKDDHAIVRHTWARGQVHEERIDDATGAHVYMAHDLPAEFAAASRVYLQRIKTGAPSQLLEDLHKLAGPATGSLALVALR